MQHTGNTNQRSAALVGFDSLPDSAHVDVRVVAPLLGGSIPSVWRWSRLNKIPRPVTIGQGCTRWNVGALREYLAGVSA